MGIIYEIFHEILTNLLPIQFDEKKVEGSKVGYD